MTIPGGGKRNVRFNIQRFIAKSQRNFQYVYAPQTDPGLTPIWQAVELPKPAVDHSIKLLPYTYTGYDTNTKQVFNAGLDMKTSLADQVNLVGSINPDFRNIENQILSIDFSRFERLAGETRPFFQEGRQYSNSALFASQRIRGFDAGINSYSRLSDKTSFSLVNTVDFGNENDTIVNFTHDPTPNDSFRLSLTSLERPTLSNEAYLVRYSRNQGPFNLFIRDMASKDSLLSFGRQSDAVLSYAKGGLAVTTSYARAEAEFRPRLGVLPGGRLQGAFRRSRLSANLRQGRINDWGFSVSGLTYDHIDGSFYRKESFTQVFTTIRPGFAVVAAADLADFEGSKDSLYSLNLSYPRGNPYKNVTARIDSGRQAGIQYRSMTLKPYRYRLMNKLQFSLRHQSVDMLISPSSR